MTSDALTDVFVFPPNSKTAFAYEAKRLSPLAVSINISNGDTGNRETVPTDKALGTWKIILNTSSKDAAVSVQLTASVGPLVDGSIQVYRHPSVEALESQAQHLMDGAHYVDTISADPKASNHRRVFIFPLNFNLELGASPCLETACCLLGCLVLSVWVPPSSLSPPSFCLESFRAPCLCCFGGFLCSWGFRI